MAPTFTEKMLRRLQHHYIIVMLLASRTAGAFGGLIVVYYVELMLTMPDVMRLHFRITCVIVVVLTVALTVSWALWETRSLRKALKSLARAEEIPRKISERACYEAVNFNSRHHRLEAWFVPTVCLIPVLLVLRIVDDASILIMVNVSLAAFMAICMALMSTFFAVEHCMKPVIRLLIVSDFPIDFSRVPKGRMRFRFGLCFTMIIMTTSLMNGTLARQRASDILKERTNPEVAVRSLIAHSTYIMFVAVTAGVVYSTLLTNSVASRVVSLIKAMEKVANGDLSERLILTGNDEIDILGRQFNNMVGQLGHHRSTIQKLNENLEERVQQRTQELEETVGELQETQRRLTEYNEILDNARVEAEAANQAKSDFLANISHELRTPLNGVIGMADLLLSTSLNKQQRKYAHTVMSSGGSLLELLNEVLDFSKIEACMLELEAVDFDLRLTFQQVVDAVAHKCGQQSLQLACFIDPAIPTHLIGDPIRLRQVLMNLTNNAVKFTDQGCVVVEAAVAERTSEHVSVRFAVRDTGIGIPKERFNRLFEKFSQVDASTTRKYGGTGLGLAICKELCELMGGTIGVDSEFGVGSTFWFTAQFDTPVVPAVENPVVANWVDDCRRILVVMQDSIGRAALNQQLDAWGFDSAMAGSAGDALRRLREAAMLQPYDLILVDDSGRREDGVDLVQSIRNDVNLSNARVIALVPLGCPMDPQQVRMDGFTNYISTPVLREDFFEVIAETFSEQQHSMDSSPAIPVLNRPPARPLVRHAGARILVVEDNEINQEVAQEILTLAGYQCDIAENGLRAVEILEDASYDLVFMDCHMPVMDGFDATREIRKREAEHTLKQSVALPIVALTANTVSGERERCLAIGMNDYLTKPLDPIRLIDTIEHLLNGLSDPHDSVDSVDSGDMDDSSGRSPSGAGSANHPTSSSSRSKSQPDESTDTIFDYESLLKRCMGDSQLAHRLVLRFERRLPDDIKQIAAAVEAADATRLSDLAHTMKGAAANLSLGEIRAAAIELQQLADNQDLKSAPACFERLNDACDSFIAHFPKVIALVLDELADDIDALDATRGYSCVS